ncbi:hypothetical protein KQ51_01678 [Candidatus Izimaplasma bacterium HR1]|jgi:putative redox protein|uniref:OsmC family protein n=1 Tax=Candidatus Izimoplasma sp. HR1 TaxID=1541959 RepID=UPI0004F5E57F|nr:hypothetical protein KQ51_01678 [Candidatus Izimaplasma bacterium HR1]
MANNVNVSFNDKHEGILKVENYETKLSYKGEGMAPYELFLGGYASCLHATFIGIMRKRKLTFTEVTYDVNSYKRDEVPTIINKLVTNVVITGADEAKQKQIIKSMDQAEKYCSISYTIANLDAETELNITFK